MAIIRVPLPTHPTRPAQSAHPIADAPRLTRDALEPALEQTPPKRPSDLRPAPIRIVHLGLGNFHRAHQAWYTAACPDADQWGIAAFTGRSPRAATALAEQDGLYTLIERGPDGDRAIVIPSIVAAYDGSDMGAFLPLMAAPETAIVTLTITEPGYRLRTDGTVNVDDPVVARDIELLRRAAESTRQAQDDPTAPQTPLARLLLGLHHRRLADAGPLAIVPCDNIPANGALVRNALAALADETEPSLRQWLDDHVSVVSTSVDRITPRTTDADRDTAARLTGYCDLAPVVTEPFADWVLCGDFPAGHPAWVQAGARFVDDIEPFERRKLWLLNGAHSLLAYLGLLRGHATVAEAINDETCRAAVEALWDEGAAHLPSYLDLDAYRAALVDRFSNLRIEHRLAQIGMEGTAKLPVRIAPVVRAERAAGRPARGGMTVLAAWATLARGGNLPPDAGAEAVSDAIRGDSAGRAQRLLAVIDRELAADREFVVGMQSEIAALNPGPDGPIADWKRGPKGGSSC